MAGEERYDEMKTAVLEILGEQFRPEFLNRVDDIIVFHPLERDQIRQIAELQVRIIAERLETAGMGLELTTEALDFLGNVGFDPVYGARPLKRALQQYLENPLAEKILDGSFGPGDTIQVDVEDGELVFSARRTETAVEEQV